MITVSMSAADTRGMRFAYSPLIEITASLRMIASRWVEPMYRGWFASVRDRLRHVDLALLMSVVPARDWVADFLFAGATGTDTTIDDQLRLIAGTPTAVLRHDLEEVWQGGSIPEPALKVLNDPTGGSAHLADALGRYWSIAIDPHWTSMRAVLDDDLAFRAHVLTKDGLGAVLASLHPSLRLVGDVLYLDKRHSSEQSLAGSGMVLVPSIFLWDRVIFVAHRSAPSCLTYATRGVGNLWPHEQRHSTHVDPLAALLGRSRAVILDLLALPTSTTELAVKLGQSPGSISQHLSVLRAAGLATCWRSGRRVLYRRTPLADRIASTNGHQPAPGTVTRPRIQAG